MNDFFETDFINRGDSVIRHHYQTLWNVYRCRRRAAVAAKVLLWFGTVLLLLMLSGVLRQKIDLLCEEYGRDLVRGACFFLALFLLFSTVMEYRHIVTGLFRMGIIPFIIIAVLTGVITACSGCCRRCRWAAFRCFCPVSCVFP